MTRSGMVQVFFPIAFFFLLTVSVQAAGLESRGRDLINSAGCKGCHRLHGTGGTLGPAFDGMGNRLSRKQLRQKLIHPQAGKKGSSMMPSYAHLSQSDLKTLVDYLKSLK